MYSQTSITIFLLLFLGVCSIIISFGLNGFASMIGLQNLSPVVYFFSAASAFCFLIALLHSLDLIHWLLWGFSIYNFPDNKEHARENQKWALDKLSVIAKEVADLNIKQEEARQSKKECENKLLDTGQTWRIRNRLRDSIVHHANVEYISAENSKRLYKRLRRLHIFFMRLGFYLSRDVNIDKTIAKLKTR